MSRPGGPAPGDRCTWGCRRNDSRGSRRAGRTFGAGAVGESGEKIVSESQVHLSDETEDAPATDGEVGEADVLGEFDEPEEAGEFSAPEEAVDEADGAVDEADGAADAADDADGAAADADDGAGDDPVARFTAE